ncbi:23S rRNA (uracil(1939)-C(5))-methyltransferase RlmD [Gorillibacterium timonense]|uniref:23S rRNA (uracil(1939)-C(5))-methyltransferase RlmD n=1 Tax=Gorillibacterium timonense TaxID=1689269 RepID=UPI00071C2633|nr:23S rRNA (uracil(1939)-C(5))-methyltransferase RlmD [Gorillibacterium timonense]
MSKKSRPTKGKDSARKHREQPSSVRDEREYPVAKNEEYEAEIIGLTHDGEGVGRVNGFTLFVAGALPGERARVKVLKVKKQYGYAKLLNVLEASPDRIAAPCPIFDQCGGCQLQHLSYEAQLRHKRQIVVDALERIGKLPVAGVGADDTSAAGAIPVHPVIGMPNPWNYRNKAQVPLGEVEGGLVGGFYAQGSHRIIDMDACMIQHEANDDVISKVKEIASSLGISAYKEETGEGLLRHVVAKIGFRTGEIMVVLVVNGDKLPQQEAFVDSIREAIPGVKSICMNRNTRQTNVIFGDRTDVLWGSETIYDYIGDIKFAISARSFYQVNPVQTEVLYRTALDYAALTGGETVIDAYCGIGTISLFLAQHAGRVYGVEIVAEAIADARRNAALNGLANVDFAVGKAEEIIPTWRADGITPDVIVVDPPRKGCEPELLDTMLAMRPERIVYVSCNPATLARDLRVLVDGGYRVEEVTPVDMFPHTVHVESVTQLVKNETGRGNA